MESKLNLVPVGLLTAFIGKLLLLGANSNEALIIASLSLVVMGFEYLSKSRRVNAIELDNKEFQTIQDQKIKDQNVVINRQNEVINELAKKIQDVHNSVTAVKMQTGGTIRKVGT